MPNAADAADVGLVIMTEVLDPDAPQVLLSLQLRLSNDLTAASGGGHFHKAQ